MSGGSCIYLNLIYLLINNILNNNKYKYCLIWINESFVIYQNIFYMFNNV